VGSSPASALCAYARSMCLCFWILPGTFGFVPMDVSRRLLLVQLFVSKGQYPRAIQIYQHLLSAHSPDQHAAKLHFNLAQLHLQQARHLPDDAAINKADLYKEAILSFQRCLELDPRFHEARLNLSGLHLKLRQPLPALEHALQGLSDYINTGISDVKTSYNPMLNSINSDAHENPPMDKLCKLQLLTNLNIALRLLGRGREAIEKTWNTMGLEYDPRHMFNHILTNHDLMSNTNSNISEQSPKGT
jgi:tetratricopeptide (TPR) repeat protein